MSGSSPPGISRASGARSGPGTSGEPRYRAALRLAAEHGLLRFSARGRSMWPLLRPTDLAIAEPLAGAPREGDVLVYRSGSQFVAHRLIGVAPDGRLRLHGDFALTEDRPLPPSEVLGRVVAIERGGRRIALDSGVSHLVALALPRLRRHAPGVMQKARAALTRAASCFDDLYTASAVRRLRRKSAPPLVVELAKDDGALRDYDIARGRSGEEYAALAPDEFTVVARIDDRIVGCTHVLDPPWTRSVNLAGDLWIHDTHVPRRLRGLGIGRAVSEAALSELRRRGVQRVRVAIATENRRSRMLYQSLGFVSIGHAGGHDLFDLSLAREKALG